MEEWRQVRGFSGYEVSSEGSVRSLDREIIARCRWGGMMTKRLTGRVLRDFVAGCGYRAVQMGLGPRKKRYVHRLVAEAFLGLTDDREVNHRNGNKADNRLANLEALTPSQNMAHAHHELGLRGGSFGSGGVRYPAGARG